MQQSPAKRESKLFNVFTWNPILLNECHEHFMDFIICKIKNSAMFLISQAFLALATRRRCGAGRPGGSGGRAARDPTYGEPPGRCQRSSDFHVFCSAVWKLLLKTYENQCILNVFPCTKRPHVWPPAWALQADLWFACFLCFGIASLRLLHGKLMKTLILFKPAHVLQRFACVSLWFFIFSTVVFYDLDAFWMLLERLHWKLMKTLILFKVVWRLPQRPIFLYDFCQWLKKTFRF